MIFGPNVHMYMSKRGIILGVIILVFMVLGVFIFSYNSMVRQQNIRSHHELIGEIASMLAMSGVQMFADQLVGDFDNLIKNDPDMMILMSSPIPSDPADSPGKKEISSSGGLCSEVKADINAFLSQLHELKYHTPLGDFYPECTEIALSFENIYRITPDTIPEQFQAGRDPVEKVGEMVLSCTVDYRGLKRKAGIKRQFRVVSMLPGIFSRFSVFTPFTPWAHSYNAMGVRYDGKVDDSYEHPHPTPRKYSRPLKVFNNTESYGTGTTTPDDRTDLKSRGWIFLGPARTQTNDPAPVILKIPAGYENDAGGHFMFAMPPGIVNTFEVVPTEQIVNPTSTPPDFEFAPTDHSVVIGGRFQGFYTYEDDPALSNKQEGAARIWKNLLTAPPTWTPNDRWLSASTWLYPFGDRSDPSRTLMVGPVLAGFLKWYFIKITNNITNFTGAGVIKGVAQSIFSPTDYIKVLRGDGVADMPLKYESVFLRPDPPDPKNGIQSLAKVMPYNSVPDPGIYPPSAGIAFNVLFDFMHYPPPGTGWEYPNLHNGTTLAGTAYHQQPFFVPSSIKMIPPPSENTINGLHPYEDFRILLTEDGGHNPNIAPDNVFFYGDLFKYRIGTRNLLTRITHIFDISDAPDKNEEKARFGDALFRQSTSADSCGQGWWIPKTTGIFLIKRRELGTTMESRGLPLPGRIALDKSMIIVLSDGDIIIPGDIQCFPDPSGEKGHLLSLVSIAGDIYLAPHNRIEAYLVALSPGQNDASGGGRLLSINGNNRMNIFGGVAVWEMGLYEKSQPDVKESTGTTMSNFPGGGVIKYNPRFNPSSDLRLKSMKFILEDKISEIVITGGK